VYFCAREQRVPFDTQGAFLDDAHMTMMTVPAPPSTSSQATPLQARSGVGINHPMRQAQCSFFANVEFSVASTADYTVGKLSTRFECCDLCRSKPDCFDFVFRHSTRDCVLLPYVPVNQLVQTPNDHVISGSLRTTIHDKVSEMKHGLCSFKIESGYATHAIGELRLNSSHNAAFTIQDCCDACKANEECVKLSFHPGTHTCQLFYPQAELFSIDSLISGVLVSRYLAVGGRPTDSTSPPAIGMPSLLYAAPPHLPVLMTMEKYLPPPPPMISSASDTLVEKALLYVSAIIGLAMFAGVALCISFFIRGGSLPKSGAYTTIIPTAAEPDDELSSTQRGKVDSPAVDSPLTVTVDVGSLQVTKQMDPSECALHSSDLEQLLTFFISEFPALLKSHRRSDLALYCDCAPRDELFRDSHHPEGDKRVWLAVTKATNLHRALGTKALRITRKPMKGSALAEVAFPIVEDHLHLVKASKHSETQDTTLNSRTSIKEKKGELTADNARGLRDRPVAEVYREHLYGIEPELGSVVRTKINPSAHEDVPEDDADWALDPKQEPWPERGEPSAKASCDAPTIATYGGLD